MLNDQLILVLCLFGFVAILSWWLMTVMFHDENTRLRSRLKQTPDAPTRPKEQAQPRMSSMLQKVGQAAASPFMPKTREKQSALRRKLGFAGIYTASAIRTVQGFKLLFLAGGLLGGYLVGLWAENMLMGLSVGGLMGYILPTFWLKLQIGANQVALTRALPDALDLLVICVEAGLTVDAAMQRVGVELALAHPSLSRELEITHMEMRVGLSRADALKNLGVRTGSAPLEALATMLVQAERFGTSIAQALRIHAESLRLQRQHDAEETAAKASVKLTFPVVLFIFPAVLIILAGPAAIGLFNSALFNE